MKQKLGRTVLRYTALTYNQFSNDLRAILKQK